MSGASDLRAYILHSASSPATRRELIARFGSTGMVANELSRLAAKGLIQRVGVGVYSIPGKRATMESALEIAAARCRAFGKAIVSTDDGKDTVSSGRRTTVFSNGCRTSFSSIHGRIFLTPVAPAKVKRTRKQPSMAACSVNQPRTNAYPSRRPKPGIQRASRFQLWSERLLRSLERLIARVWGKAR